ncbi:MAG: MFS transporter [Desulfovibrionaceae bacterium]|nr:MFS transporter [Desulfovibrionaceae bacterium]
MSKQIFRLGNTWLILYLTFLGAFAPLSTDMYLPSLPHMAESLNTSYSYVSLSISGFLLLFALSMLFWGPFSDKYGRKITLILGSSLYIIASIAIALAPNIIFLLIFRGLQAIGSGAMAGMSLAVAKDLMRGTLLERVVSIMQTLMIVTPMVAPVIGGGILIITSWRGVFWCLSLFGLLALFGAINLRETCQRKSDRSLWQTLGRIFVVLQNKTFLPYLLLFSALSMPFMAYLGVSSTVYQDMFGLSPQSFSCFFAVNAAISMLAPLAHLKIFRFYQRNLVIATHLIVMAIGGICVLLNQTILGFCLFYALITFSGTAIRPPSTILMLESIEGDTGAVTSLINCGGLLCGSLSMVLAVLPVWGNPIDAAATISLSISCWGLLTWIMLCRR